MIFWQSSFLGLSFSDRGITCAEVNVTGGRRTVRRLALFQFASGVALEKPDAAGQALASFLREHRFSASRAVVGVPARWLIATERELPPVPEDQARSMLRLQVERLSAAESGELVSDYVGRSDPAASRKVLLVAMQRSRLELLENLLDSAGLTVLAVTSSVLALAAVAEVPDNLPIVLLERQGAELVWRREGEARLLRHVSVQLNGSPPGSVASAHDAPGSHPPSNGRETIALGTLGAEITRAVSLVPGGNGAAREMLFWDGVGLEPDQLEQLSSRLGLRFTGGEPAGTLGVLPESTATGPINLYGAAVSLALVGAQRKPLPLDFKRSRLSPPRRKRLSPAATWGILAGSIVTLVIVTLYVMVSLRESELARIQQQIKDRATQRDAAAILVGRMNHTSGYYDRRPPMLECLREMTMSFRDDERIWATSFTISETRGPVQAGGTAAPVIKKGQISGKTLDQKHVLDLQKRLMDAKTKFTDVKVADYREAGGRSKDMNFTITFTFVATE